MDFTDLKSALNFRKTCPYCEATLEIRSKKHVGKVMASQVPKVLDGKIYFEESLNIDIASGKIEKQLNANSLFGKYYCSLRLECMDCYQYYHLLNLAIDTLNCKLLACTLNNVSIKRVIGKYEYTLKISKSLDQTLLTKLKLYDEPYPASEDSLDWSDILPKDIEFPYIELDFNDPDKTIMRLDQLILFT